jgi:formate hydrogenlyase subunit 3/multisubunit Na+/H+ antiporter MnhD subunit
VTLFAAALLVLLAGGLMALALLPWPRLGASCAVLGTIVGAALGGFAAIDVLRTGASVTLSAPWDVPYGALRIAVDPLSAFFLLPVFGLSALAAIYGQSYLAHEARKKRASFSWFAFNVLVGSMAVVVVARQAVLFLVAWEVMSLCAFVLVTFAHERAEVRRAGWTYLIATHIATAFLIAMFLLFGREAHSFDYDAIQRAGPHGPGLSALLFFLALVGFGVKAGLVPMHVWLPEAHAAAPSHVSALMSGVLVKMGIYGLLRTLVLLGRPAVWWGPVLAFLGMAGAVFGVALALYQRDVKRTLAYSTIENLGLIFVGIGTGLFGAATNRPHVAAFGAVGAFVHLVNHSMMKGLLFMAAGSVLHGAGTKDMEQLGGVMKRMPRTSVAMVFGAAAIAGLPPMNGFVGEWLLYLGLLETGIGGGLAGIVALFGIAIISLVGALAVLCFVRLVGIALLGEPRSVASRDAHESPLGMTGPMIVLAAGCVIAAVYPSTIAFAATAAVRQLVAVDAPPSSVATMGLLDALLWLSIGVVAVVYIFVRRGAAVSAGPTWSCGYARPTPRMQYTARSFAALLSERMLPRRLRARASLVSPGGAVFARPSSLTSEFVDPLTRGAYEPFLVRFGARFARLRWVQQGKLHVYVVYIVATLIAALAWTSISTWAGR